MRQDISILLELHLQADLQNGTVYIGLKSEMEFIHKEGIVWQITIAI